MDFMDGWVFLCADFPSFETSNVNTTITGNHFGSTIITAATLHNLTKQNLLNIPFFVHLKFTQFNNKHFIAFLYWMQCFW